VLAGVGVLGRWVTPGLVDEVVAQAGGERPVVGGVVRRPRLRALPDRLVVYFVLGLCLFSGLSYRAVVKQLTAGLAGALGGVGWRVPAATALTRARRRLGERPFELLVRRLCGSLLVGCAPWSHVCGLLAVAWDGTTVRADASAANIAAFGRVRGSQGGHYPQLRLVALIACGTRALLGAVIGPARGKGSGEQTLARGLTGGLRAGMLLLADRNFYSYGLWQAAAGTGADLLWRVTASLRLRAVQELGDGSWLAHINDPAAVARRARRNGARRRRGSKLPADTGPLPGITVRVIEFTLTITTGARTRAEPYRLITTLTDPAAAPAGQLAAGYAWRWAIETGFREVKTYLGGPGQILRGRTPELARQELWATLAIYQAIRAVICGAAAPTGSDPSRISFTATLHATRRTLATARTSPHAALAETHADILTELIPRREGRICARVITRPKASFPSRDNHKGPLSQHADRQITIHPATHTTPSQAKHHDNPQNQPP
jgi:hypothetical protein